MLPTSQRCHPNLPTRRKAGIYSSARGVVQIMILTMMRLSPSRGERRQNSILHQATHNRPSSHCTLCRMKATHITYDHYLDDGSLAIEGSGRQIHCHYCLKHRSRADVGKCFHVPESDNGKEYDRNKVRPRGEDCLEVLIPRVPDYADVLHDAWTWHPRTASFLALISSHNCFRTTSHVLSSNMKSAVSMSVA